MNLPVPVVPLHRSDGSGGTFEFTQYLSKQDADGWGRSPGFGTTVAFPAVPGALGENGDGAMVTGCAQTPAVSPTSAPATSTKPTSTGWARPS